jgi:hypothetical protein
MKITEQENKHLQDLYKTAKEMPVITFDLSQKDWATLAWDRVRDYMDELGMKYNYDPATHAIDPKTGEILPM